MADYFLKQGDNTPTFTAVLKDLNNQPINLTGATGQIFIRPARSGIVAVTGPLVIASDQVANKGMVSYTWGSSGIATPGEYLIEFRITFSGGNVQSFPNDGYAILEVVPKLA
jgi:hypothetical protein